jgi:transposase
MPIRRRGLVTDRLFRQHPTFFRAHDILQVKYELLRAHFVEARAIRAVCQAFGYSRQSFYVLRDRFRVAGLEGLRPRAPGRQGPTKCTREVLAFLQAAKAQDPRRSGARLAAQVAERFGVQLHRRTVERVLGIERHRAKKNR